MSTELSSEDRLIAGYAALAVAIHVLEAALPSPLPGVKPGLANVITLIVISRHGLAAACWVSGLRVLVGSLMLGTFLTPTFILSLSGACGALLALSLASAWNRLLPALPLSAIGMGMLAACLHMLAQFGAAWTLFIPHPGLLVLLPVLLSAALLFGLLSGWLAEAALRQMPAPALAEPASKPGY